MPLSEERKATLMKRIAKARTTEAPENAVGQWIASFFEAGVSYNLVSIIEKLPNREFALGLPGNKKTWRLQSRYGEARQIDYVISDKNKSPVIIFEDKWLKDERHLKDKGSWITALEAVQDSNPSVRRIIAILAGEWNETTLKTLRKTAYVFHIPTQTVYDNLAAIGIEVRINKKRVAYENPERLLGNILDVVEQKLNEDSDILVDVGKRITTGIARELETAIQAILYPRDVEVSTSYDFSVKTNWGRVKRIEGKCAGRDPDEIIRNVKHTVEE